MGAQIEDAFGSEYGSLRLVYSRESEQRGTGGAIRHGLDLVDSDPVLVLNGDSYCDVDLAGFLAGHRSRRASGSLVLSQTTDIRRYGRVRLGDNWTITGFQEKATPDPFEQPHVSEIETGWVNAGVYLLSRRLIAAIPVDRAVSIEREVFPAWAGRDLYGYPADGDFLDIGTPESYARAAAFFAE